MVQRPERTCGGCTKCCHWLIAEIKLPGEFPILLQPGNPCPYVGDSGCTVYKDRPDVPCKSYKCEWLKNNSFPDWMRPDKCGSIVSHKVHPDGTKFYEVVEAGEKLRVEVLSWLVLFCKANGINLKYMLGLGTYKIGSDEFTKGPY